MPDAIVQRLLEHGVLGIVTLICLYVAYRLALKVDSIQERRVTDVEKVLVTVSAITIATDKNTDAIERLVDRIGR